MKIDIDLDLLPKLKDVENVESTIQYLIQIGYNNVFINEQNNLADNICNRINNDITNSNNKVSEIDEHIKKLFGLSSSSSKKGEVSENIIYELFQNNYKDYCYEKKRSIAHNADGELTSPSGLKALVEIKNYEINVNKDEVDKFKYDLQFTNITYGLFISIKSGIIGHKYFDYETYILNEKEYHIIYISKIYEDDNLLNCSIMLLEKLFNISSKTDTIKTLQHNNLKQHFEDLNNIIDKTKILHNKYINLETIIKSSFNEFYQELRQYEIELKNQTKKIWSNIENDIENIYLKCSDSKEELLSECINDKCLIIMSRLFEILKDYDIVITNNTIWDIVKDKNIIGKIKKYKDKMNIEFNNSIKISLTKHNIDNNLKIIKNILE